MTSGIFFQSSSSVGGRFGDVAKKSEYVSNRNGKSEKRRRVKNLPKQQENGPNSPTLSVSSWFAYDPCKKVNYRRRGRENERMVKNVKKGEKNSPTCNEMRVTSVEDAYHESDRSKHYVGVVWRRKRVVERAKVRRRLDQRCREKR
jgi:hypothetical protein